MSNRKLLLSGSDPDALKGITIALAPWTATDGTAIESITEAGPPTAFGFGTWEQAIMTGGCALQNEFGTALSTFNTSGRVIARSDTFQRSTGPISAFSDIDRGDIDSLACSIALCLLMDNTTAIATVASEAEASTDKLPVGIGFALARDSSTTMISNPWYREPGDSTATLLASSPNFSVPISDVFNGNTMARVGITWQKGKLWTWYEDYGGGGTRFLSDIFDLASLAPWQVGGYGAAGLVMSPGAQVSGRIFMDNYYIQR